MSSEINKYKQRLTKITKDQSISHLRISVHPTKNTCFLVHLIMRVTFFFVCLYTCILVYLFMKKNVVFVFIGPFEVAFETVTKENKKE